MKEPIETILSKALNTLREKDPTWEAAQPDLLKISVIEHWKKDIRSSVQYNTRILWELPLPFGTFGCLAPIFCPLNWEYNPYMPVSPHWGPSKKSL
jgi:hypothetical protein